MAALRLAEKGYRVTVLEAGRRFADSDFAASPWQISRLLWAPRLGLFGILCFHPRRHLLTLRGTGVGGGSLVYGNVHYRPQAEAFDAVGWDPSIAWASELAPYFDLAERMLGTTEVPARSPESEGDRVLHQIAENLGAGASFHPTRVGVHFGPPATESPDPYFAGRGPARAGCTSCARCILGCRVGAKNTLVKNYLYLAEQQGAQIRPLTTVTDLRPGAGGRWAVTTVRSGPWRHRKVFTADHVVLAAGAWGTAELLHRARARGALPALSRALGTRTCTNREVLVAAASGALDVGPGVTISSALRPDERTLVQLCRVGPGTDPLSGLFSPCGGQRHSAT